MRWLESEWWKLSAAIATYLLGGEALVRALYVPLGVLLVLDLVTGLWAARRTGQAITSPTLLRKTTTKLGAFLIVLIASRMLDAIISAATGLPPSSAITKAAVIYLTTHEVVSVDENLARATGIGLGAVLRRFLAFVERS
jgi:phage-related holin